WVRRGTDGKVVLSTGANIPNYLELKSYQERVNEWHRCNPGNIAAGTLSGNANPDADQHIQQQLIHEVLHLDSVGDKGGLSKESHITALKMELNALKNQVFARIMKSAVMLSVEELCSIVPDVRNQMRTAVTPKRQVAMGVALVDELDDALPGFSVVSDTQPTLSTNAISLTSPEVTNATSIDPIKTYVKSLDADKDPAILMVAHNSQAIRSIMMTINHRTEVEAVVDSGSQIISMAAEVASDLGLIYDPNIVLNMQSANGTIDRSLGLAKNVPCTIGDVTFYLQIHIIRSPAYDLLLGRPFDILARSIVRTLSNEETTLTISDPNSGLRCMVPTFSRGRNKGPHGKGPLFMRQHLEEQRHLIFHPPLRM
ncbi:hypothetical protein C0993_012142, partial [Termitomyces sp. T159_Od127]